MDFQRVRKNSHTKLQYIVIGANSKRTVTLREMAKKISKNSRAARTGEAYEPEAKSLEQVPRAEKTDLTSILIRTTAKNEALLEAKLHRKTKNKVGKKSTSRVNNPFIAGKVEKALNITGRLDGKIAKSINRAKYIQTARKAGWDSTNDKIKQELAVLHKEKMSQNKKEKSEPEEHMEESDEMEEKEEKEEEVRSTSKAQNVFSMLADDVEV